MGEELFCVKLGGGAHVCFRVKHPNDAGWSGPSLVIESRVGPVAVTNLLEIPVSKDVLILLSKWFLFQSLKVLTHRWSPGVFPEFVAHFRGNPKQRQFVQVPAADMLVKMSPSGSIYVGEAEYADLDEEGA